MTRSANRRTDARWLMMSVSLFVAASCSGAVAERSSTSAAASTPTATSSPIASGIGASMVDLDTGQITPLPASIATAGSYYAVSPDRTMVAYSSCCSPPDPLFVANIDGTGVRQISAKGQDVYGAQWSPDGSMLVYQQRDGSTQHLGNLFVQDVATGQRTQITNFDQSQSWDWWFTFPSFAPDRPYVFFQLPRGVPTDPVWDLWCVSQTGGTPILVRRDAGWGGLGAGLLFNLAYLSPISKDDFTGGGLWIDSFDERAVIPRGLFPPGHLTWLRWSPGGKRISYADRGSIYVLDVTTDKIRRVAKGGTAEWFNDHTLIVGPGG